MVMGRCKGAWGGMTVIREVLKVLKKYVSRWRGVMVMGEM